MQKIKSYLRNVYRALSSPAADNGAQSGDARGASVFDEIYRRDIWLGAESKSGPGSSLEQTGVVRRELPRLLAEFGVKSMLDVPCGDFNWMKEVELGDVSYTGGDIVEELVARNRALYAAPNRNFIRLDLLGDAIDRADLVFCRDCLVHFSFADIRRALGNLKRSGSTYLLTTTFTGERENADIRTGEWRPLNLQRAPFYLPAPLKVVNENCTEDDGRYADKSLGLWNLSGLPD